MSFNIQTLSLSEICTDISYGYTSSANSEIVGPKFLRITDIQGGVVDWDTVPYCEIPESKLNKNLLSQGDIVVARTGNSTGENYMFSGDEPSVFASYLIRFKVDSNIANPHYVWLQMRTRRWWDFVSGAKSGSAQAGANATVLGKFEVNLPPKHVQDYVVEVISCLSSKISLNTSTNQTLEQMAQAIFKSWFVDFDPVKAKMNGEQPEGMDAATASLFPEKLIESELGLIPEGWKVGTLDSHTSMIIDHRGKTPKKLGSDWVEGGYPAISAKNIKSKKIVRPDTIRFIDEVTYKKWMKEPLIKGDIIMTSEAPMGELYFFDGTQDFCLSQRLYGLRANSDVCSPEFLFNWLQTTKAKSDMEGRASGTTALGIKQAELRKVKILTPPRELLEKYSVVASNLVDMAAKNNAQNTVIEDLRDTLLPKLLSGELNLIR
ncbi:TPA: restriction endonuclease subunit S [Photobacterium damselae]